MTKKNKSSSSMTRKGWVIWISLTIVASAWMFILGIFVGRGTAPVRFDIEKLQKELALLREAGIMKDLRRYKIDSGANNSKTELGFYETLKDDKGEAGLKADNLESKKKSLSEDTASGTKKTGISEKIKTEKVSRKSKSVSVNSTYLENKNFTIQVASLKDPKMADKMVAELKTKGYPVHRSIGEIPGKGTWYRVRVGYYKSKTEANRMLGRLKKDHVEGIVVNR